MGRGANFDLTSFVDRDMYMRYRGGGIGHFPTRVDEPEPEPDPRSPEVVDETDETWTTHGSQSQDEGLVDEDAEEDEEEGDPHALDGSEEIEYGDGLEEEEGEDDIDIIERDGTSLRAEIREDLGYAEL